MTHQQEVDRLIKVLRWTLGGTALVAGADKFTNLLTNWEKYLSPEIAKRLPIPPKTFMRLVGVIEIGVGLGILSGRERAVSAVMGLWLTFIAGNLVLNEDHDIAVRDLNMAVTAYALSRLASMKRWSPELELEGDRLDELDELHRAA